MPLVAHTELPTFARIYDPRTGTERWTPNAPLAVRFLVRANPAFRCGLGAQNDEIDDDNFTAVANLADERVDIDPMKSLELRGMSIITDSKLIDPDDDGKYRYFPAYLTEGVTARVAGADIQTGDGYSLIGGGDPTWLPSELTEGYGTKYNIIIKQFGQSPYFDVGARAYVDVDTFKNLCKDIFAIGFACGVGAGIATGESDRIQKGGEEGRLMSTAVRNCSLITIQHHH